MIELFKPVSYDDASNLKRGSVCNGCGTKGLGGWFIPNTLWGLSIEECCNIHDWMYYKGSTLGNKEEADRVFLNNMLRVIAGGSRWLRGVRRVRARNYYRAVKYFGGPAFWGST